MDSNRYNDGCDGLHELDAKILAFPDRRQAFPPSIVGGANDNVPSVSSHVPISTSMFSIHVRKEFAGHVMVFGKPTRKHSALCLRIPICQTERRRLEEQVVGSLAMGVSALLHWALDELIRQGVTIEAQPTDSAPLKKR